MKIEKFYQRKDRSDSIENEEQRKMKMIEPEPW